MEKIKRPYGNSKTERLSGWITPDFKEKIKNLTKTTGLSEADQLEIAFDYMMENKEQIFICCSSKKCKAPYYPLERVDLFSDKKPTCKKCGTKFKTFNKK